MEKKYNALERGTKRITDALEHGNDLEALVLTQFEMRKKLQTLRVEYFTQEEIDHYNEMHKDDSPKFIPHILHALDAIDSFIDGSDKNPAETIEPIVMDLMFDRLDDEYEYYAKNSKCRFELKSTINDCLDAIENIDNLITKLADKK